MSEVELQSVDERAAWSLGGHAVRLLVHAQHEVAAGKVDPHVRVTIITLTQCLVFLKIKKSKLFYAKILHYPLTVLALT